MQFPLSGSPAVLLTCVVMQGERTLETHYELRHRLRESQKNLFFIINIYLKN